MIKLVSIYINCLLLTYCVCNVCDFLTSKDDDICKLLLKPEGVDDIIIDLYKNVTKFFGDLADGVKHRNETVIKLSETVLQKGEPRFLNLKYSLGRLKLHYSWGPRESNYFEFLNMNARFKWSDLEEEFKNYTIALQSQTN